jgi:hypothetical protein
MWDGNSTVTKVIHYYFCLFIINITFVKDLIQTVSLIVLLNTGCHGKLIAQEGFVHWELVSFHPEVQCILFHRGCPKC